VEIMKSPLLKISADFYFFLLRCGKEANGSC
jgi:hypothetical protein